MAEGEVEAQVSSPVEEAATVTESQIQSAMLARVTHFKEQADSLTFEGVRRLLEKDLGLESHALDVHKKFVKKCLMESLDQDGDDNATEKVEVEDSTEKELPKTDTKDDSFKIGEKMDDSPVMGLLTGEKKAKAQAKDDTENIEKKELPTKSTVKDAIWKRAKYLKANSTEITMAGVRKLLEEDLELEKNTLLPFKKFISEQVDLLLNPPKASKSTSSAKKDSNKSARGKASKSKSSEESSNSSGSESEEDTKAKKKVAAKRKVSEEPKKRKAPVTETKAPNKKRMKVVEKNSDGEAGGGSEDEGSRSSDEKSAKKKEVAATPSYGKRVELLKSIIKSCGMSVPPVIYKKAKQVPEDKREAFVRKELEEILSREGLSSDPSEKEIKDVKKRKERAKELEGIDMSNIVSSTRRRSSTTSFTPPPKPPKVATIEETKEDDDGKEGDKSDEEGESEGESDEGESEEGSEDGDESQSEEVIEESDGDDSD